MRSMLRPAGVVLALSSILCILGRGPAAARVSIVVDLTSQTIHVESKEGSYDWPISSGRPGLETPTGSFGVSRMEDVYFSKKFDDAPMPHAIFFTGGYAIHGAYSSPWGHPASHGCVRLPVQRAELLFDMVKAEGARIDVVGDTSLAEPARRVRARGPSVARMGSRDRFDADPARFDAEPQVRHFVPRSTFEPIWPDDE